MNLIKKIVSFVILLVGCSCFLNAATFYIDPSTSDPIRDGTQAHPFSNWGQAATVAPDGTYVLAANNTYLQKCGTTATNYPLIHVAADNIVIGSYGSGARPIIICTWDGTLDDAAIQIESCNNALIRDVEVIGLGQGLLHEMNASIKVQGATTNNAVIYNCNVHGAIWGIRAFDALAIHILNTEIHDVRDDGFFEQNVKNIEIGYCNIHDVNLNWNLVGHDPSVAGGDCVQFFANNTTYIFRVHHSILDHTSTGNKQCLFAAGNTSANTFSYIIEYNTFAHGSSLNCIDNTANVSATESIYRYNWFKQGNYGISTRTAHTSIYGNIFSNMTGGIEFAAVASMTGNVYNNTFYNLSSNCINNDNAGATLALRNNIFFLTAAGQRAISFNATGTYSSDYNLFYPEQTSFLWKTPTFYHTLAGWQNGTGYDLHSLVGNPLFINPGNNGFHLQAGSPAIDNGTTPLLPQDKDGTVIPQGSAPDIGAYEYTGLIGYWPLDSITAGTTPEKTDYHNNGNITGSLPLAPGYTGPAGQFSGTAARYIVIPSGTPSFPVFNNMNTFTLAAWIYPTSFGSSNMIISKVSPNRDFVLQLTNGRINAHFAINSSQYTHCYSDGQVLLNKWSHVAAVWAGDHWQLYLNGQLIKESAVTTAAPQWTGTTMQIGAMIGSYYFDGKIDEVKVFNFNLSAAQILALCQKPAAKGIWTCEGNVNDQSSNPNNMNGTLLNGATFTTGIKGQSLSLSGTAFVKIATPGGINNLTSFSLSAWIYPTTFNDYNAIISRVDPNRDFVLQLVNGRINAHFAINFDQYTHCFSDMTVPLNQWSHVAAIWTGDHWQLYLNGQWIKESAVTAVSPQWTGTILDIGAMDDFCTFQGNIDEVKVFDGILSADQVLAEASR